MYDCQTANIYIYLQDMITVHVMLTRSHEQFHVRFVAGPMQDAGLRCGSLVEVNLAKNIEEAAMLASRWWWRMVSE